jgi:lipopolysaccharide/colanic/teichoic acid biosynthesis glycosyltransferase
MTSLDLATQTLRAPLSRVGVEHVYSTPRERERRVLNVAVAAVGLVVTAPVLALIAAAIRLTSRGPVIYRQTRVGIDRRSRFGGNHRRTVDLGGQPFTIYKFRTMAVDATEQRDECWASPSDPRVTRLGRVLRKYRLDELPQLYNVLRGDMNIVGPRPEQPTIFASLREQIPGYTVRQRVRPGITGWAQINQHYDTCVDDVKRKVAYDLEYLARQSVTEDLKIMLRTVPTVALRLGAW